MISFLDCACHNIRSLYFAHTTIVMYLFNKKSSHFKKDHASASATNFARSFLVVKTCNVYALFRYCKYVWTVVWNKQVCHEILRQVDQRLLSLSDSCQPLDGRKPSQAERREDGTALGRLEIFYSCVKQQRSVSEARSRHCRAE